MNNQSFKEIVNLLYILECDCYNLLDNNQLRFICKDDGDVIIYVLSLKPYRSLCFEEGKINDIELGSLGFNKSQRLSYKRKWNKLFKECVKEFRRECMIIYNSHIPYIEIFDFELTKEDRQLMDKWKIKVRGE